jgi:hypothetical protein
MSCSDIGRPVNPRPELDYYPGYIRVEFADYVRKSFVLSWLDSLGLIPYDVLADLQFTALVEVDSGGTERAIAELRKDTAVTWANEYGWSGMDSSKEYVLAYFLGTVRAPYAATLVQSIPGLKLLGVSNLRQEAIVIVEVGREASWIDVVKTFSFVTSAGLVPVTGPID